MVEEKESSQKISESKIILIPVIAILCVIIALMFQYPMTSGVNEYYWNAIPTKYCEEETLEMTEISYEDMVIVVSLGGLNPNITYILFQHDDLNDKGFSHEISNSSEKVFWVIPAPRDFALYRTLKGNWVAIIDVLCNRDVFY